MRYAVIVVVSMLQKSDSLKKQEQQQNVLIALYFFFVLFIRFGCVCEIHRQLNKYMYSERRTIEDR